MIEELVRRLWRAVGRYHALDWRAFASWLGSRVFRTNRYPIMF